MNNPTTNFVPDRPVSVGIASGIIRLVPGILNWPDDSNAWTDGAAARIAENSRDVKAVKEEFFAGPLFGRWFNGARSRVLASHIIAAKGIQQIIAAHSNGCQVAVDAVLRAVMPIKRLVLIAGAINADFIDNGLDRALTSGIVETLVVLWSTKDAALRVAHNTGWCREPLGYFGPLNAARWRLSTRMEFVETDLDHSDYFYANNFDATMRLIIGAGRTEIKK